MIKFGFNILFIFVLLSNSFGQAIKIDQKTKQAIEMLKAENIKAHIQYLSDDKLLGRYPGTPGYQMAVDYVVKNYKDLGVEPAGENNTYLQNVRLRRSFTNDDASLTLKSIKGDKKLLLFENEFIIMPHFENKKNELEGELVFCGYGISTPELGYDDYKNVDVKGKIVLVKVGAPDKFPSTIAASSKNFMTILNNALEHGASGVIIIVGGNKLPIIKRGIVSVLGADNKIAASKNFVAGINLFAAITENTLKEIFQNEGIDLDKKLNDIKNGKTASVNLKTSVSGNYTSNFQDFESYNIIGKIIGSDSVLRNEYVIHSAHLDHLGIDKPVDGDSIYNGAHDNASGVASLLEIVRIYSQIEKKPKRSILIVMVTGEEMGLLGSSYFAKNPTVPVNSIVANVNTDMPGIIAPLLSVVALGAQHSTLQHNVASAAGYFGLKVEDDPEPDQNRFIRSDQYSFVQAGIPALHIKYGNKTADGKNNYSEQLQQWREKYYHKPQDEINGVFDFEAGKKYAQLNFLIGYSIANDQKRPEWKAGDFFGRRFGRK